MGFLRLYSKFSVTPMPTTTNAFWFVNLARVHDRDAPSLAILQRPTCIHISRNNYSIVNLRIYVVVYFWLISRTTQFKQYNGAICMCYDNVQLILFCERTLNWFITLYSCYVKLSKFWSYRFTYLPWTRIYCFKLNVPQRNNFNLLVNDSDL